MANAGVTGRNVRQVAAAVVRKAERSSCCGEREDRVVGFLDTEYPVAMPTATNASVARKAFVKRVMVTISTVLNDSSWMCL